MIGDHQAQHESAQISFQADHFEDFRSTEGEQEPEQHEEFAVTGALQQLMQNQSQRDEEYDRQGPERWPFAGRDGEEDDGSNILHDQNSDRDPAMQ